MSSSERSHIRPLALDWTAPNARHSIDHRGPSGTSRTSPRVLRMRNFESIIAEDGMTGLRLARKHLPDILLPDIMLPDINGFDVCRQIRLDRATMLIPVVMVTALNDIQHRVHGFRVGANGYVTKPYGVNELFETIAAAQAWRVSMEEGCLHRQLEGEVNVVLNSEIRLLKDLNDFLLRVCLATSLSAEQVMQLRQAILEMAHNAIEWGNQHQSECPLKFTYSIHEDHLEIVVRDQGSGFDRKVPPLAAVPDYPPTHWDVREKLGLRAGGFGLLICQGMLDEMQYNSQGNEVTLIKRFAPCQAP